jgi:hypothetical protein
MTTDLEHAKKILIEGELAFVIVKDKKVITQSTEKGVAPFFFAVDSDLKGASVADKIVGKAVAFLSVYAGISAVYTPLASQSAVSLLRDREIYIKARKVVPMILNRHKDGQCPIELLVSECRTPHEAYVLLKKEFERDM